MGFEVEEIHYESDINSEKKWVKADWAGAKGYVKHAEIKDAAKHWYEFSYELPDEADPATVLMGDSDEVSKHYYTVQYKLKGLEVRKYVRIPEMVDNGLIVGFGTHVAQDFEKAANFNNIQQGQTLQFKPL